MIKVAFISDTHNQFPKVPECDLVVHCGDLTNRGTEAEVLRMLDWLVELKAPRKVLVPGNHDWFFQHQPAPAEKLCLEMGVDLLVDEEITIDGLRIWGSPWQPTFLDWAFNLDSPGPIQDKWDLIPRDGQIDILVTHGPARGVLDLTCPQMGGPGGPRSVGCGVLKQAIKEVRPRVHAFGHTHWQNGCVMVDVHDDDKGKFSYLAVNATVCDESYRCHNPVQVVWL